MNPCILFEDEKYADFLPLTFTRPVYELRTGIDLIREKWQSFLSARIYTHTREPLWSLFGNLPESSEKIWINGRLIPDTEISQAIRWLNPETVLKTQSGDILAARSAHIRVLPGALREQDFEGLETLQYTSEIIMIRQISDLFRLNGQMIRADFDRITAGRMSAPISDPHTIVYKAENIFIEPGVKIRAAILNAESGPIYIGQDADIQEGAMIHGAHAICQNAVVNMGAKLRGDSTIGPWCKVGGEVSNSVLHSYSSKGHDGFIGNTVIGAWCNLGADTNTSNLKNNYAQVKLWNYRANRFSDTGLQFCGLVMGDHSKCGINTMFNTGTVVGVAANVFGDGFPRNFIPDFAWGGASGFTTHSLPKVFETAQKVLERRNQNLQDSDKELLSFVFEQTKVYRTWENS